ncbi:MAG: hypothetical protein H8K03_14450 [Nitrospira sp.]
MTRKEWKEGVNQLLKPIDFEDLISGGLLKKAGAWYRFTNIHDLPRHVTDHIIELKATPGVPGGLAKFKLPSPRQRKMLEKIASR